MILAEFREWTMWMMEAGILYILIAEYNYDKEKDDAKKQRRTKTTKKTVTTPTGDVVTEEHTETFEGKGNGDKKPE